MIWSSAALLNPARDATSSMPNCLHSASKFRRRLSLAVSIGEADSRTFPVLARKKKAPRIAAKCLFSLVKPW